MIIYLDRKNEACDFIYILRVIQGEIQFRPDETEALLQLKV